MEIAFNNWWWLIALAPALAAVAWVSRVSRGAMAPWRFWSCLISRTLMVLALVAALAGMTLVHSKDELGVFFLVDVSKSVDPESRQAELDFVAEAMKQMDKDRDWTGLIVFGGTAAVEEPLRKDFKPSMQSVVNTDFTDLSQAVRLAIASFPEDVQKRIVLITDGQENLGDALEAARAARAAGIDLVAMPLAGRSGRDVAVRKVSVPPDVKLDEAFDVLVHARYAARRPGETQDAKVRVYRNKRYLGELKVELRDGENVIAIPQKIRDSQERPEEGAGFYQYEVVIETPRDSVGENNRAFGFTHVAGEARILLVEGKEGQSEQLEQALRAGGIRNLEVGSPALFPASMADLQIYDCVILSDVRAENFSAGPDGQMRLMHDAVESHGIGLVMVGGDQSFGVGGYYRTEVEDALPVSMDIRKKKFRASMALVIAIDQSGSMSMTVPGGQTKIQLANQAAARCVDLLSGADHLGVLYVDTSAKWAVELESLSGKKAEVRRKILANRGGGGGIYVKTALDHAYRALDKVDAAIKHIILFSDASDSEQQEGCVAMARKEFGRARTLTVIGMGTKGDVDARFLDRLAKAGQGRIYFTQDVRKLPRIFTEDTLIASKSALVEKTFRPELVGAGAIIEGIDWARVPNLHGYVTTTLKPRGEMLLKGLEEDPVLAKWQYGLGRSVAFTSDAKTRWAKDWIGWDGYQSLWPQVVRWAARRRAATPFRTQVVFKGGKGKVIVDAFDEAGEARNFLDLEARVSGAEGKTSRVRLKQKGTGRYEAEFAADSRGAYFATVAEPQGGIVGQAGGAVSYAPEYAIEDSRRDLLGEMVAAADGRLIGSPRGLFEHREEPARSPQEIWPWLLSAAIALLLIDVTARRLGIPDLIGALFYRLKPAPATPRAEPVPEPIARLQTARDAVRMKPQEPLPEAPPPPAAPAPRPSTPPPPAPEPPPPATEEGYLGRLLDAKRRAKDDKK